MSYVLWGGLIILNAEHLRTTQGAKPGLFSVLVKHLLPAV